MKPPTLAETLAWLDELADGAPDGYAFAKEVEAHAAGLREVEKEVKRLEIERDEFYADSETLTGYIDTYGETPTMTASDRDSLRARLSRLESNRYKLCEHCRPLLTEMLGEARKA